MRANLWLSLLMGLQLSACTQAEELPRIATPQPNTPWEVDAFIAGKRVQLEMPLTPQAMASLPQSIVSDLQQRQHYRPGNIQAMEQAQQAFAELLNSGKPTMQPEYQRQLNTLLISLHPRDSEEQEDPLYRHKPLLEKLPPHTQLVLLVPKHLISAVEKSLRALKLISRSTINPVNVWAKYESSILLEHSTSRWAQDLFEVVTDGNGKTQLLTPLSRYQIHDLSRSDNDYLQKLASHELGVVTVPLFFRGGNLLLGELGDKKLLFIGERELEKAMGDFYTSLFILPEQDTLVEIMRRMSGADRAVVLPNSEQLFHLDMAMNFIANGKVLLLESLDSHDSNQQLLNNLNQQLTQLGFEVIRVPTTQARINQYQSVVNSVIYTDPQNQQLKGFVPQFSDSTISISGESYSLNQRVREAYQKAGVEGAFIEERFHSLRGNLHCAFHVID